MAVAQVKAHLVVMEVLTDFETFARSSAPRRLVTSFRVYRVVFPEFLACGSYEVCFYLETHRGI